MNGYTLGNGADQKAYKNYLISTNPYASFRDYKQVNRKTKPTKKPVIDVSEIFNEFVKDINEKLKGKLNNRVQLYKTKYNFKQNL